MSSGERNRILKIPNLRSDVRFGKYLDDFCRRAIPVWSNRLQSLQNLFGAFEESRIKNGLQEFIPFLFPAL